MKIYVIRHTSVDVQPGICYGQSDVDVAQAFQTEKILVAKSLSGVQFDKIFSSPLQRCRKLAEYLFPTQNIFFDSRIMELNFGDWELKSWDEIYNASEGKEWMDNYQILPTLNGESYPEMQHRISNWLNDLKEAGVENAAVVTHAGVIRIIKHLIEAEPMNKLFAEFKPPYGSVTIFDLKEINGK